MPKKGRSKYAPLSDYLASSGLVYIPLKFEDIEKIINDTLPYSAFRYQTWWHSSAPNHVNATSWRKVGYKPTEVDLGKHTVVFRKATQSELTVGRRRKRTNKTDPAPNLFPRIYGAFGGTVRIAPGTDLTLPVGENLGASR